MPRCYIRKSSRESWSAENMTEAVKQVLEGSMGYMKASELYCVPSSTLERRVKKAREDNSSADAASKKGMMGRYASVFSARQEEELKKYITMFEDRLFGLTHGDMGRLAFELAEKIGVPNNFNRDKRQAGKDWVYGFLKRHPDAVSRHQPEATPLGSKGPSRVGVGQFYNLLESIAVTYKISPDQIYTVGEIGVITVPNGKSKIVPLRGKKPVGITADKGTLLTTSVCMSAVGSFMPPMFVFPQGMEDPKLMDDAFSESFVGYHPDGCMNKEAFITWFQRFIGYSRPTPDKPVLLLVDGQCSHTKSIEVMNIACESNVILLCYPAHSAHRLQPLDVSLLASLSTCYEQEFYRWIAQPGRNVTAYEVGKLFNAAFSVASVREAAVAGFEATGIWPCNRKRIPDLCEPGEATNPQLSLPPSLAVLPCAPSRHSQPSTSTAESICNDVVPPHDPERTVALDAFRHFLSPYSAEKNSRATNDAPSVVKTTSSKDGHAGQPVLSQQTPLDIGFPVKMEELSEAGECQEAVLKAEPRDVEEPIDPLLIKEDPDIEEIKKEGVKVKEEPISEEDVLASVNSAAGSQRGASQAGEMVAEETDGDPVHANGDSGSQCRMGTNTDRSSCTCRACASEHSEHAPDRELRYSCYLCDYKCSRVGHLKRHMRMHSGDKPYPCSICDYVSNDKTALKRHIKTHTGEKPYSCGICNYVTRLSNSLKVHMRVHTGERPYPCNLCDAKFARLGTLKKHVRGVHTGIL